MTKEPVKKAHTEKELFMAEVLEFVYNERVIAFEDGNEERATAMDDVYRFVRGL